MGWLGVIGTFLAVFDFSILAVDTELSDGVEGVVIIAIRTLGRVSGNLFAI